MKTSSVATLCSSRITMLVVLTMAMFACAIPGATPIVVTPAPRPSRTPPPVAPHKTTPTAIPQTTTPATTVAEASGHSRYYDPGNYTVTDLYLSPDGDDGNSGTTAGAPLQTITAAWSKIPEGALSATGYRLNLLPGTYPCEPGPEESNCINYFSDRVGTYQFPVILRAQDGPGTVIIRGGLNFANVHYLYLLDLKLEGGTPLPTNSSGNNLLHLERGQHVLLRGLTLAGPDCPNDTCNNLQEVLKVNQTQYLYVEDCLIGGAWHSSVDYFVVQYGHFLNNRVHTAGQWCMYIKGGTAYLNIEGNELYNCQLGFQAGQSANLAVMQTPWFHYEVYEVKFVNNLLHDIPGVGLSVAGAYNALFAYNTLYRVGTSTEPGYPLLQLVHGERNCTPIDEISNVTANCPLFTGQGAWGPEAETESQPAIPNRNIYIYNNLFYNPAPAQTLYAHFGVNGPLTPPAGFQNIPTPAPADDNLVIAGNFIWNGPADHPLGVEDAGQGCQPANPTCNAAQLISSNTINSAEPQLVNPAEGDFRPAAGSNLLSAVTYPTPNFTWDRFTPTVPAGDLNNSIARDRAGAARTTVSPPGAYLAPP